MLTLTKFWVWLSTAVEPAAAWKVFLHFGSPEKAYFADRSEYDSIEGLHEGHKVALRDKTVGRTEQVLSDCDRLGARIVTWQDADYPERLREMEFAPLVLYMLGRPLRLEEECVVSMAGTRRCSSYGQMMAGRFAYDLTKQGALVLTGVAEGCDLAALHGAMQAGGSVAALLVGGVDMPFVMNSYYQRLYYDIAQMGTLISPYPPRTPNNHRNFFYRNPVLTAMSDAVLLIEAGSRSGTLNVAMHAQEQDRTLYTIPANLDLVSAAGTNGLLCSGLAMPVCCAADLLLPLQARYPQLRLPIAPAEARFMGRKKEKTPPKPVSVQTEEKSVLPPEEQKGVDSGKNSDYIDLQTMKEEFSEEERAILVALQGGACSADDLSAATSLPASQLLALLTTLTIGDWIEEQNGGYYALKGAEG